MNKKGLWKLPDYSLIMSCNYFDCLRLGLGRSVNNCNATVAVIDIAMIVCLNS